MKDKDNKGKKPIGFNILENECIWMKSGLVAFKQCYNAYDCNTCQFDKAMAAAVKAGSSKQEGEPARSFRHKSKDYGYMDRQCRHMLSGRVGVRKCGNDFRCDVCEFDQILEDIDAVYPMGAVPLTEVSGYRYSESYYYHGGHTWARLEYGGRVRVGMDDFALKLLGRPDGWELPKIGDKVRQADPGFALKRDKNWADVLSPIEGTVLAVNRQPLKEPALPHADPYEKGWLFLIEPERLKRSLESLHFGEHGKVWLTSEAELLQEMALGQYSSMAATGAQPVDDVFGNVPEIGWKKLVRTFLRT